MFNTAVLIALRDEIRNAPVTVDRLSDNYAAISQACADLAVANHQIGLLRETLSGYADESFYDEGLPANSMASQDRGKKAAYVLRLTDPEPV